MLRAQLRRETAQIKEFSLNESKAATYKRKNPTLPVAMIFKYFKYVCKYLLSVFKRQDFKEKAAVWCGGTPIRPWR